MLSRLLLSASRVVTDKTSEKSMVADVVRN